MVFYQPHPSIMQRLLSILLKKRVQRDKIMNNYKSGPFVVDIEMLKRYDKPGPRYTSYPTAPKFSTDFTASDYKAEIAFTNSLDNPADLSLYFHLPFCDTLCYFCG